MYTTCLFFYNLIMLKYTSNGRILDEEQLFEVGDRLAYEGEEVVVEKVTPQSIWYEHRPIASYKAFFYTIKTPAGKSLYVQTDTLTRLVLP